MLKLFCFVMFCVLFFLGLSSDLLDYEVQETEYAPSLSFVQPQSEYLQKWAKKFTELNEIPQCSKVPEITEEERAISKTCATKTPKTNENLLCDNIKLFSVIRNMCAPYTENEDKFRKGVKTLIKQVGVGTFATMPFEKIYPKLWKITGIEVTSYISRDINDLIIDVLGELSRNAQKKKKEFESLFD